LILVKNDTFAYVLKQDVSKFLKVHMTILLEVKTLKSTHACEVYNIGQFYFDFFDFFLKVYLV